MAGMSFLKKIKKGLTYYQNDNIIILTIDIINLIITKRHGGLEYEKDINCSRYAEGLY